LPKLGTSTKEKSLKALFLAIISLVALPLTVSRALASTPDQLVGVRVCADAPQEFAACAALRLQGTRTNALPSGFGPADLQSAYRLSATAGSGQTVAIVDAYDDPSAASDLNAYRSKYGLSTCTTSTGCFRKVNQTGGATYPSKDGGWAEEISLDLDMVSAICPRCHILLVEASSNRMSDLGIAENEAAKLGANEISNSWGGGEFAGQPITDAKYFTHPGVVMTAASGDGGYGVGYPASSDNVIAVGGTSLQRSSGSRGWTETVWSGAGSGCSGYELAKPAWQTDTGCKHRTVADVSAVADPYTGVAVYDSFSYQGYRGWLIFGGTSVSTPIVASVFALAGNAASIGTPGQYLYSHARSLNNITSGANGSCSPSYLCTGVAGYNGPTGLGTPNGTGAF
jgi:subtilase family serine protease